MDNIFRQCCIVIDPSTRTVRPHPAPLTSAVACALLGCQELEAASLPCGDVLLFDGERVAFHRNIDVFTLDGAAVPGGRAILGGFGIGDVLCGCRSDVDKVRQRILWHASRRITGETWSTVLTPAGQALQIELVYEPPL